MTFFLKNTNIPSEQSSIVHIHSDTKLLELFYKDFNTGSLRHTTISKDFTVVKDLKVAIPVPLETFEFHCWYRPTPHPKASRFDYTGSCIVNDKHHHFEIKVDPGVTLTVGKEFTPAQSPKLSAIKSLEGITVERHVQRSNKLYVTGVDNKYHEQVFLEICIASDKALRRYHLRSDCGDLRVNTINIDSQINRIYLGGDIAKYSDKDLLVSASPYFEFFNI